MRFGFRDGAGDERACRDELLARKTGKRSREQKHQQSRELVPHGNLQGSSCSYVADDDGLFGVRRSTTLSGEMVTKRAQRYQVGSFASQNETVYCHRIRFTLTAMSFLPPWNDLLLFCTAALVLLIIPGPAVLYVVARSLDQGRRAGLASACGIASGGLVHVLAATLGLSALLVSSAAAYAVVKYTGAAYLFYLGIKKFRERTAAPSEVVHVEPLPLRRVYAQGVVVNVLNPKTAIFFFAFLPQFVNPARGHVSAQFFALGMVFTVMGLSSDSGWALTAGSAAGWLRRNHKFMRNQHYVTGTVYLGLGMATAVTGSRHK